MSECPDCQSKNIIFWGPQWRCLDCGLDWSNTGQWLNRRRVGTTTTRQRIILAVANGARSTREIAEAIGISPTTVNNYFYNSNNGTPFENGEILQWG